MKPTIDSYTATDAADTMVSGFYHVQWACQKALYNLENSNHKAHIYVYITSRGHDVYQEFGEHTIHGFYLGMLRKPIMELHLPNHQ